MLWSKSKNWWILCSPHQVFIHLFDSILPSYGIYHSISISISILISHYPLYGWVCYQDMEVYNHQLHSIIQKILLSSWIFLWIGVSQASDPIATSPLFWVVPAPDRIFISILMCERFTFVFIDYYIYQCFTLLYVGSTYTRLV